MRERGPGLRGGDHGLVGIRGIVWGMDRMTPFARRMGAAALLASAFLLPAAPARAQAPCETCADGASVGTVVEGRDIATVVFPNATLKIFLTASLEERGRRRGTEGIESIQRRDEIDQNRETSPLRRPVDARLIDTTDRSVEEIVKEVVSCLESLPLK